MVEIHLTQARITLDEKLDRLEVVVRDMGVKKNPKQQAAYHQMINPDHFGGKRSLVNEISSVISDLIQNPEPIANLESGFNSIELLVAAYVSDDNNHQPVKIPLSVEYDTKWLPIT